MTVPRRRLAPAGPELSQVCYGSMRLTPETAGGDPAAHLCRLHDLGIDTHHSSHEYDSHGLYLEALAAARGTGREFHHIVKLAEPGFDHHRFDGSRLTALLDDRLTELKADIIASVQWLFRTPDAQNSEARVAALTAQIEEIAAWSNSQVEAGKIGNLSFFPYSTEFASAVMKSGVSTTPAMYLNLAELESAPFVDESDGFIALRPLAGGRLTADPVTADDLVSPAVAAFANSLLPEERIVTALRFPLLHPAVTTTVISVNSPDHVDRLLTVADTAPDEEAFKATVAALA